jgi:sialidase-1
MKINWISFFLNFVSGNKWQFMLRFKFIVLSICLTTFAFAQSVTTVFESGKEGFSSYRIPAIIQLPNKRILAFAEGRLNSAADFGNVKIVMKSSDDNGRSWSALKVVVDYGNLQAGNAAPVVDLLDPAYPDGRIIVFYNTGNVSESDLRKGLGLREIWYISSTDNGMTWSSSINITNQVHHANGNMLGRSYESKLDWRSYANTPGHAVQSLEGKYKGRIYIAANHSSGPSQPHFKDYNAHGYYTDDHGKTFKLGASLEIAGSNEATAAFISNDRLILNARNQSGQIKNRIVAYSNDGGTHFDTSFFDLQLPDPICEGTILKIGQKKGKSILAFVNASDTFYRNNLTVSLSFDEGKTWPIRKLIDHTNDPLKQKQDYSAYSDIVAIGKREIGILYELDNYAKIVFKQLSW